MSTNLNAEQAAFVRAVGEVEESTRGFAGTNTKLQGSSQQLLNSWRGQGAGQFRIAMDRYNDAARRLGILLQGVGEGVHTSDTRIQTADSNLQAAGSQVANAAIIA